MRFGIGVVDQDHETLLELASTVLVLLGPHGRPAEAKQVFYELVDYTFAHFCREECLMKEHGCPDLETHEIEHREIAAWLGHLRERLEIQGDGLASHTVAETISVLRAWVVDHLSRFDAPAMRHILGRCQSEPGLMPTLDSYQRCTPTSVIGSPRT